MKKNITYKKKKKHLAQCLVRSSCATAVNSLSFTYLFRISSTISLEAFFLIPYCDIQLTAWWFLIHCSCLLSQKCTAFCWTLYIPLSTLLVVWQMLSVAFCVQDLPLAPLGSFAPTPSTLLCFNGLHQWSTRFLASGWVWPIDKEKTVSMRTLFPQLPSHGVTRTDCSRLGSPFHIVLSPHLD